MSRKKKQDEQQFVQQQMQQPVQPMPNVFCGPMGGIYPVPPATNFIQLPPIVQPIVMVPFASQQQPLATYLDESDDYDY